jgi:hypothetical protein
VARILSGVRATRILRSMAVLDDVLPQWHHRERHAARVHGGPVLAALEALTWREVPLFAILMAIRSLGRVSHSADRRILADFTAMGFSLVARTDGELVYAGVGRPWSRGGGMVSVPSAAFRDFAEPGWAKMAVNFRVADGALTTETRVWLTDASARRGFAAYWLLIRPFSGLIRRTWLAAAARRAQAIHRP